MSDHSGGQAHIAPKTLQNEPIPGSLPKVLFVCVENSNRSQMAQAFARIHGTGKVVAFSAGSRPSGKVNPKAIEAMRELGYDLGSRSAPPPQHHGRQHETDLAEKRRKAGTGPELNAEKPDMTLDPSASHSHTTSLRDLKVLLKSSSFRAVNIIGILITFFVGALNLYAVQYLKDVHHIDPAKAGPIFGGIAALGGLGGVFFGSYLADRLTRRGWGTGGRLAVIGAGMVLATPFIVAGLLISNPIVLYPALGFGVFFTTWYIGPILAALHDVVPAYNRAAATGAYFFLIHMLGDALSPIVVAEIKTQTGSLKTGMLVAVAVGTLGGIYALLATRKVLRRKLGPGAKS